MKMKMKKNVKLLMVVLLVAISYVSNAQKKEDKSTMEWRYEVQCAGIGSETDYLIKVYTYSTKRNLPMEQAKKNAIHAVLFKGYPANSEFGCGSQSPMCKNPNIEFEKREFFDTFFANGGAYMKFVNDSSDGNVDPADRMKVGKEYKVGIIVSVNKTELRKYLEGAGIIRGLSQF
jgi:hypothetical protein